MSLAFSVIRADVRLEIGNPPTAVLSDAEINSRINDAYAEIATRYRHPEMRTSAAANTVSGTATYSLPTRYWYATSIRDDTNDRPLLPRSIAWINAQDTDTTGQPQYWTREGSTHRFYPTPNGTYSINVYYVQRPVDLSADADTTIFDGREWDEIIKWGAVWRCWQRLGLQDQMIHGRNIWRTLVGSMPEADVLENEGAAQIAGPLTTPIPYQDTGPTI